MNRLIDKLKKRWEVETLWQVVVILFIFSITGITTLYVKKALFGWMGIGEATPFWLRTLAWLFTVLPAYQVLFLFYGFILGQFRFVWKFEKESYYKIKRLLAGGSAGE